MANSVVHFEIPLDDVERGHGFYREVFGWQVETMAEFDYASAMTGKVDENGMPADPGVINGGMMRREEPLTKPMITIGVDDIEATLKTIEGHGGTTVLAKQPVGQMGFAAYFTDSEGNTLGLWESAR